MPLPLVARAYRFVRSDGGLTITVAILALFLVLGLLLALVGAAQRAEATDAMRERRKRALGRSPLLRLADPLVVGFAALALADLTTYLVTSVQLGLAYPDPVSGFAGSIGKFLGVFALSQIPLAVAEGILGVLVFRLLADVAQPELQRLGVLGARAKDPVA